MTENSFTYIYESKHCRENWETITCVWTYEEFTDQLNRIKYLTECDKAAEMDQKAEEERHKNSNRR